MLNNSIESNQSQLNYQSLDQNSPSDFYNEYESDKTKTFIKEFEGIPGIPSDIEEIKQNPIPQDISDEPAENFLKMTTEYDKAYSFEVPKKPGDEKEEEKNELNYDYFLFFLHLLERDEQLRKLEEEKGIKREKKIQFKSVKEFHETCFKKFPKGKYENNPEQEKKDLCDFINSIDLFHTIKMIMNYNLNFDNINSNIENEKDNESFEFNTEEEANPAFNQKYDEDQLFS